MSRCPHFSTAYFRLRGSVRARERELCPAPSREHRAGFSEALVAKLLMPLALSLPLSLVAEPAHGQEPACGDISVTPSVSVPRLTHLTYGDHELGNGVTLRITAELWTTPMRVHLTGKVEMIGNGDYTELKEHFHQVIYDARSKPGCQVGSVRNPSISDPHGNPGHGFLYDDEKTPSTKKTYTGTLINGSPGVGGIIKSARCTLGASGDDTGRVGCDLISFNPVEIRLSPMSQACGSFDVGQGEWRFLHPVLHRKGHGDASVRSPRMRVSVTRNPLVGEVRYAPDDRIGPEVTWTDSKVALVGNLAMMEQGGDLSQFEHLFSIPILDPNDILPHCSITRAAFRKGGGPSDHTYEMKGGVEGKMFNDHWNQATSESGGAVSQFKCRVDTPSDKDGIQSGGLGCRLLFDAIRVSMSKRDAPKNLPPSLAFSPQTTLNSLAEAGTRCTKSGQCVTGACDLGMGSGGTGKCVPRNGTGQVGQFCSKTSQCSSDSFCSSSNTCSRRLAIGDSCKSHGDCKAGLACDNSKKRCTAGHQGARDGEFCTASNQCSKYSFCPLDGQGSSSFFSSVDAAIRMDSERAYFFEGSQYLRFDIPGDKTSSGYPKGVSAWPGVWSTGVNAAVDWGNGKLFFFRDGKYIRYDKKKDRADSGYPKGVSAWPGVWASGPDAVIDWGNGKVYMFKGREYLRYDKKEDRTDSGYPKSISSGGWDCVWSSGVDAAVSWGNGIAYFFRGDQYIRFDMKKSRCDSGYPRSISSGWQGQGYAANVCKGKLDVPRGSWGSDLQYRCTSNEQCKSNYCNYPVNARCYPAQNKGRRGDFCVNNSNCAVGKPCNLESGKNWGYCGG